MELSGRMAPMLFCLSKKRSRTAELRWSSQPLAPMSDCRTGPLACLPLMRLLPVMLVLTSTLSVVTSTPKPTTAELLSRISRLEVELAEHKRRADACATSNFAVSDGAQQATCVSGTGTTTATSYTSTSLPFPASADTLATALGRASASDRVCLCVMKRDMNRNASAHATTSASTVTRAPISTTAAPTAVPASSTAARPVSSAPPLTYSSTTSPSVGTTSPSVGQLTTGNVTSGAPGNVNCSNFTWTLQGSVDGVAAGANVTVSVGTATDDTVLETATAVGGADGIAPFVFRGLPGGKTFFVKYEHIGYALQPSRVVQAPTCPAVAAQQQQQQQRRRLDGSNVGTDVVAHVALHATRSLAADAAPHTYNYEWVADASRAGTAASANVVRPPQIRFENTSVRLPDDQAAGKLFHDYGVLLDDGGSEGGGGLSWSSEYAYRLLSTLSSIPQRMERSYYEPQNHALSKWTLLDEEIMHDIEIRTNKTSGERAVRIARKAFVNAAPQVVRLDGVRGEFFSRRLHHAVVRFVTGAGADMEAVQHIAEQRYGTTIASASFPPAQYTALTAPTTTDNAANFQPFERHPEEPLLLLSMFEELPSGLHKVPGLRYVLRRADGTLHPRYPLAPAVAWPGAHQESYVEFMEQAFLGDLRHTRRLILHEKAHFLWERLFDAQLRADWTAVAGWFRNPNATSGWSTTQQVEFVSAYAHLKNPNEDMAESISYYVENPAKLQACCAAKFAFIRDRVMSGYRYISRVRSDLAFRVYNLSPDFTYPGKILRTSISVAGAPLEDKVVSIEVQLHASNGTFDGAQHAYFRLFSEIGTYSDHYLYPVRGNTTILGTQLTISKYAKAGLWQPQQIEIKDLAGNQRFAGMSDFGWRLYVNNPLEDVAKPAYVPGTLTITAAAAVVEGRDLTRVTVSWLLAEDSGMKQHGGVYMRLVNDRPGGAGSTSGLQGYGYPGLAPATGCAPFSTYPCYRATISLDLTEYRASANYTVANIQMKDVAKNVVTVEFGDGAGQLPRKWVEVLTANHDSTPPELNVNNITVNAVPTNPLAPNGETLVTIVYFARDDKSGVGKVSYRLLDPQGGSHFEYHYHSNFYTVFFRGDPTQWARYEINVVLPVGSPPGMWGIESMEINDKVDNALQASFVENLHFEAGTRRRQLSPADLPAQKRFEVRNSM